MNKLEAVFIEWFTTEDLLPLNGRKVIIQDIEDTIIYCTFLDEDSYTNTPTFHNDYTNPLELKDIMYWTYGLSNDVSGIKDDQV